MHEQNVQENVQEPEVEVNVKESMVDVNVGVDENVNVEVQNVSEEAVNVNEEAERNLRRSLNDRILKKRHERQAPSWLRVKDESETKEVNPLGETEQTRAKSPLPVQSGSRVQTSQTKLNVPPKNSWDDLFDYSGFQASVGGEGSSGLKMDVKGSFGVKETETLYVVDEEEESDEDDEDNEDDEENEEDGDKGEQPKKKDNDKYQGGDGGSVAGLGDSDITDTE
ncbi:hypothetical protein L1987_14821 [Smallanthus sonchifolius]|uniref:Uncharacterized protein n=1 Tax=Smallanthus sonchifolius TaxID=185202 RepID=A0ACB9J4P8_9ASTR|nr:hypothetical protein L1987_14821 [Smallanthus sonchifolius]